MSCLSFRPFYRAGSSFQAIADRGIRGWTRFCSDISIEGVISLTVAFARGVGSALSNSCPDLLTVAFILFEAQAFPSSSALVLGDSSRVSQFTRFIGDMERYMVIKTIISMVTEC